MTAMVSLAYRKSSNPGKKKMEIQQSPLKSTKDCIIKIPQGKKIKCNLQRQRQRHAHSETHTHCNHQKQRWIATAKVGNTAHEPSPL
jgi:hypothetical protein